MEFAGNKTYVVATDGNFSGAPTGAQTFTSLDAAMSAINSGANGQKRRLLLKRGQTFGGSRINPNTGLAAFQVGAFGSGSTSPTITTTIRCGSTTTQYSIWGINIKGSFDPTNPYTSPGDTVGVEKAAHGWVTLSDVSLRGQMDIISFGENKQGLVAADVLASDWKRYGIWSGNGAGTMAFVGFFGKNNQNAIVGDHSGDPGVPPGTTYVSGSCARINSPGGVIVIGLADISQVGSGFNSRALKDPDNERHVKSTIITRSGGVVLGCAQSNLGPRYDEGIVDRLRTDDNTLGHGLSGHDFRLRRFLCDKLYLVTDLLAHSFAPNASGYVMRNAVGIYPNAYRVLPDQWLHPRIHSFHGFDPAVMSEYGADIYNNTLINRRTNKRASWTGKSLNRITNGQVGENNGVVDGGPYSGYQYRPYKYVKIGNNVSYSGDPRDANENTDDLSDLDTTEMFRTGFQGIRWLYANAPLWTEFKHPDGTKCYYEAKPGAPSYKAASPDHSNIGNVKGQGARIAVDDFFGNLRGEKTSRGAFD